ncbi:MAG: T9SS type A sorting domain-containing protein [Prolixibacteraceae bacterium]|jgi:hypothetical protein|nr:T9SS type A sorting domain-containing protein [Prolixibacteraceae bacterium]MBT6004860.1 T9SS type A sorting domain-containing protein [Prolixibacteraceae bacterium]MBT6763939.1 T9SS type A sorting domain-containing protein [Prolixibacteraceae bacterium]MBT6998260.1 T9SS type A sorting domain-containing protein [Prolixibacteraceae bacterium]MBT7393723.1 T9SS type A sorting domain-containing protein [Prolixibacteraceae bacterium]
MEKLQIPWPVNVSLYKRGELKDIYDETYLNTESLVEPVNRQSLLCYPNPTSKEDNIEFNIIEFSKAKLEIYNFPGEKIKTFTSVNYKIGKNNVLLDGKNSDWKKVSTGTYLIKLQTSILISTEKIVMLNNRKI